jgi:sec-independent protein translocase protein TatA
MVQEKRMDFLGMGPMEIGLILLVALLIWGPNRVIEIGRTLGKTVNAFKKAAGELTTQVNRELEEQKKQALEDKPEISGGDKKGT